MAEIDDHFEKSLKFMSSNNRIAIWTVVYDILPIVNTKWNQATGPTPEKNYEICLFFLKFIKKRIF